MKKKILIVEDEKSFVDILKQVLGNEGFDVVTADDGEAGVVVAKTETPDLILSDVLMPRLSGPEMVVKIKEFNKNVSVIFLTNIKGADYTEEIKKLGEFDYLIKSDSEIKDIVAKIKNKLGLK